MFIVLKTDNFELEYLDDILTVEYNDMFFKTQGHNIINLISVISNVYPGTFISSFIQDDLIISQDAEYIYINDNFLIPDEDLEDLITILMQANSLIYSIVTIEENGILLDEDEDLDGEE